MKGFHARLPDDTLWTSVASRTNTLPRDVPEPGTVLGRAYRVVEALEGSPAGDTLRAMDESLARPVLVTVMRREHAMAPLRQRVLDRAKARSRVIHTNVGSLYYFGAWNDRPTIVSELVEGDDLPSFIASHRGRLSLDVAFDVIAQILRGLEALHAQGAAHGGLRPSGIRITESVRVVIAELAVELPAVVEGTDALLLAAPSYAAPELVDAAIRGELPEATVAADIFAAGVIAYSLLTGFLPTDSPLASSATYRMPMRPSELSPGFSRSIDEPLLKALATDPAQRHPSAKHFRDALASAREQRVTTTVQPRFLLVDDDLDYRAIASLCLQTAFHDAIVVAVSTGREALERIERESFSLVLLDLMLPDMNGIEVTAAIRGCERGRDTPVVVVTGRGGAAEWRVLSTMGVQAFVVKPIDPRSFIDQVRRTVER